MSTEERQQQFEAAIRAHPDVRPDARIAKNFGFSNSARVIEAGLFACTNNLEAYSAGLADSRTVPLQQFIFLCVLTFPPNDEVYFAVVVTTEAYRVNEGLVKLFHEGKRRNDELTARGERQGKISNNVKFYITDEGSIFFHNHDFMNTLTDKTLIDRDCVAKIDSILFSIWPPAASARRSLLARDFVGYLGNLVGREKVHELQVWSDPGAAKPSMKRSPSSIPIEEIENAIANLGGYYPSGEVRRFHAALNFLERKHFVILSGLSGTGKTQLALKYARAVHGVETMDALDPFLFVCSVRPEWTDPTGLTGYPDVLSNQYVVPRFLEAILVATAHKETPVFVVLDEMNLARVEYYFSDVLSAIETEDLLQLHSSGVPLEGSNGGSVRAALPIPPNLFVIGTINVDETTNPISDKVLDRALIIDMSSLDMQGFLTNLIARQPALTASKEDCGTYLVEANAIMIPHGQGFGYRVAEEVLRYHAFAARHLGSAPNTSIDELMVQKVLVKLRGSERQRSMLSKLVSLLQGMQRSQLFLSKLLSDLDEFGSFQATR